MSTVAIGTAVAGGLSAAGSIASSSIQSGADENAQQLQAQEQEQALQFQENEWNTQQQNEAPFLKAGTGAELQLSNLLSTPGKGLLQPWDQTFQAPTLQQAEQQPGYEFQEQQGETALQNSAAASGELLDPNTERALENFGEQSAQSDYNNVYNQALQTYGTNYNTFETNQANEFNRLSTLAGGGQVAANTLGQEGQQASQNVGNIDLTGGAQQGQDIVNAGTATASGYAGATNALSGSLNNYSQLLMMQNLLGQGGGGIPSPIGPLYN